MSLLQALFYFTCVLKPNPSDPSSVRNQLMYTASKRPGVSLHWCFWRGAWGEGLCSEVRHLIWKLVLPDGQATFSFLVAIYKRGTRPVLVSVLISEKIWNYRQITRKWLKFRTF